MNTRALFTSLALGVCSLLVSCSGDPAQEEIKNAESVAVAFDKMKKYGLIDDISDREFIVWYEKYKNGDAKITDFPCLTYIIMSGTVEEPVPASVLISFIAAGAELNEGYLSTRDGRADVRPLHAAVHRKSAEIISLLLRHGANPNLETSDTFSPFAMAIRGEDTKIVDAFLDHGVDLNVPCSGEYYPLEIALLKGNDEMAAYLVKRGANPEKLSKGKDSPILMVIIKNMKSALAAMLDAGLDPNSVLNDETMLSMTLKIGSPQLVKTLLEHGADPNKCPSEKAASPLHVAVSELSMIQGSCKPFDVLPLLIKAGADVNMKDSSGWTPLMSSVMFMCGTKDPRVYRALIEAGADVNAKDEKGRTALSIAESSGNSEAVRILKAAGATEVEEGK